MAKDLKIGIIGCGAIGKDHCRRIIHWFSYYSLLLRHIYHCCLAPVNATLWVKESYRIIAIHRHRLYELHFCIQQFP